MIEIFFCEEKSQMEHLEERFSLLLEKLHYN